MNGVFFPFQQMVLQTHRKLSLMVEHFFAPATQHDLESACETISTTPELPDIIVRE